MKKNMHPVRITLAATLLAAAAIGATSQEAPAPVYVAMGSSFAAGPGIPKPDPASPPRCARSTENYAHLFAAARGLVFRDVSCSGATTEDILHESHGLPAQLEAVTPATRLVTITIGGNDVGFIRNLYAWTCENTPTPAGATPRTCNPMPPAEVEAAFPILEDHLRQIVTGIHDRAPAARIVFVDYITIVPPTGSCSDRLPLTAPRLEQARTVATHLAALTEKVARATGSDVLKASELSAGHDVCSATPWATPSKPPAGTRPPIFAAYHPNAAAMRAIADKLEELFPEQPRSASVPAAHSGTNN